MNSNVINNSTRLRTSKEILDFSNSILAFLNDLSESEDLYLANKKSQFYRRIYIKSVFSCLEGTIWLFKQLSIKINSIHNLASLSIGEQCMLNDSNYELKSSGDIKLSAKFLRIDENLRFTYKIINRLLSSNIEIDTNSKNWQDFQDSIRVRNRIMHPKQKEDLEIKDDEIKKVYDVSNWLNDFTGAAITSFNNIGK